MLTWLRRGISWWLDYAYVGWEQLKHFLGGRSAAGFSDGALAPVVLLPGVYETWQFLRPVAKRMHELGHPVHVVTKLGYNRATIADAAAISQRYLDENDLRGVILIAHSKGGLIGKHQMVLDDTDSRITGMVAVNSPFGGSLYARFIPGRTIHAFSPRDKTLMMLGANATVNSRITSIYAEFDPHIPGGSTLAGATNIELPVSGHFRPLGMPVLLAEIEKAVARL